mmetsp:Transcript_6976/g.10512  ORF Transcript_6976/g.10512 Transcript_6976/m.10512 type:complete len:284 (-) Transcript_6976:140-991(-)|eukprot:CAMPEP_0113934768 /NCGR_PEP_ID=MMETSP1339-20121228/2043_1 /TAXON_ID=94617 /ORGANISM="Fibrocapsa japonica" /LENGTH=283 /DNA_ID=CAMNT_0000936693 /DNA_START=47 /DNA_END=898 /DNA_ORIENTATION=+ /assembly_acc=CAM_ASM_000762
MNTNDQADCVGQDAFILAQNLEEIAEEYSSAASSLEELVEACGIDCDLFSQPGKLALQSLSDFAQILDLGSDLGEEVFYSAMLALEEEAESVSKARNLAQSQTKRLQKQAAGAQERARQVEEEVQQLLLDSCHFHGEGAAMSVPAKVAQLHKEAASLHRKTAKYQSARKTNQELLASHSVLGQQGAGGGDKSPPPPEGGTAPSRRSHLASATYWSGIGHQALLDSAAALRQDKGKLEELQKQVAAYHGLPAEKSVALAELAEAHRRLKEVEVEFSNAVDNLQG